MKVLWTLLKVAIGLVLLVPVSLIMLGLFGTVLALTIVLLRMALLGLLAYGAFKLVARLIRGPRKRIEPTDIPRLAPADPYFQAAMRELDRDLPEARSAR